MDRFLNSLKQRSIFRTVGQDMSIFISVVVVILVISAILSLPKDETEFEKDRVLKRKRRLLIGAVLLCVLAIILWVSSQPFISWNLDKNEELIGTPNVNIETPDVYGWFKGYGY